MPYMIIDDLIPTSDLKIKSFEELRELYLGNATRQQLRVERRSLDKGKKRYYKEFKRQTRDNPIAHKAVSNLFTQNLEHETAVLRKQIEEDSNKRGKPCEYLKHIDGVPVETLALICMNSLFQASTKKHVIAQNLYTNIGRAIFEEKYALAFEERSKTEFKKIMEFAKKKKAWQKFDFIVEEVEKLGKDPEHVLYGFNQHQLSHRDEVVNASRLVSGLLKDGKMFIKVKEIESKDKTFYKFKLTDQASQELLKMHKIYEWMRPEHYPTNQPPIDWKDESYGAYLSKDLRKNLNVIKTNDYETLKLIKDATKRSEMDLFYEGINFYQSVAYKLDTKVLDIIKHHRDVGHTVGKKCPEIKSFLVKSEAEFAEEYELHSPNKDDWEEKWQKKYFTEKVNAQELNYAINGNIAVWKLDEDIINYILDDCNNLFYLPMQADFRQRLYFLCHFSPHREDIIKALFHFGNVKKPIGKDGLFWMKVHVANLWGKGIDKQKFEDRASWVDRHIDWIKECALDPIKNQRWEEASSPYQFVSAIMELIKAIEVGETYVTGLPLSVDASSSGYQIYSCLLRSQKDARLTNLYYDEDQVVANDIYTDVAKYVTIDCNKYKSMDIDAEIEKFKLETSDEDEIKKKRKRLSEFKESAYLWLKYGEELSPRGEPEILREFVKRQVMTFGYSSNLFGFAKQIRKDMMSKLNKKAKEFALYGHNSDEKFEHPFIDKDTARQSAWFMATMIYNNIPKVVKSASKVMDFLREVTQVLGKENVTLQFQTPTGFIVNNKYNEFETPTVKIKMWDAEIGRERSYRHNVQEKVTDKVKTRKSMNTVAPNIVHSLDASILILAGVLAKKYGMTHMMTVHDSFACLPSDMELMGSCIKTAMVHIFKDKNILQDILDQNAPRIKDKDSLPEVPEFGDEDGNIFNIDDIYESYFSFA